MKRIFMSIVLMPMMTLAEISISNIEVFSGYPWKEVVIGYTIKGNMDQPKVLRVFANDKAVGKIYECKTLEGVDLTPGRHVIKWHAFVDGAKFKSDNVVFTIRILPPPLYCVIDLSEGTPATRYPVMWLDDVPSGGWTEEYKTTKLVLRRIEPGTFEMGDAANGGTTCSVRLTESFYMGVFEVTDRQWALVMGNRPSNLAGNVYPVENISYNDIRGSLVGAGWPEDNFVDETSFLGKIRSKTGLCFDLPTEAQWEYACRAGTTTVFSYGNYENGEYMWYGGNRYNPNTFTYHYTCAVGTRLPNVWGLYDMHGNVWEMCLDWYGSIEAATDPKGADSGSRRVCRGGGWDSEGNSCTSSYRGSVGASGGSDFSGFRLAWTLQHEGDSGLTEGDGEAIVEASSELVSVDTSFDEMDLPVDSEIQIAYGSVESGVPCQILVNNESYFESVTGGNWAWKPSAVGEYVLEWRLGQMEMSSFVRVTEDVQVSDVKVFSGCPWKEVIIGYTISGGEDQPIDHLKITATDNVSGTTYECKTLEGVDLTPGSHVIKWDASADGAKFKSEDVVFTMWVMSPPPPHFCVIDLSGGASATHYPVTELIGVPSGGWTDEYKTTKLVLRRIEPGTYKMQNKADVTLTKPFYMGVFEVTQKQYSLVMGSDLDYSCYVTGDTYPVSGVRYDALRGYSKGAQWPSSAEVDASSFMGILQSKTGLKFDLPTEAQWEYACRAGTVTTYYWGDAMDGDYAWCYDNASASSHPVGGKIPNAWGLYDMCGNVAEWCLDWYGSLAYGIDPAGPKAGSSSKRVVRGGSYDYYHDCHLLSRYECFPTYAIADYGFRLCRTLQGAISTVDAEDSSEALAVASSGAVSVDTTFDDMKKTVNTEIPILYGTVELGLPCQILVNEEPILESAKSGIWIWNPSVAGEYVLEWQSGQLKMSTTVRVTNETGVSDVEVFSGYPWSEVVVGYTITESADQPIDHLEVLVTDNVSGKTYECKTLDGVSLAPGRHVIKWNALADGAKFKSDDVVVTARVFVAPPPLYCIIDLSGGKSAPYYPVTGMDQVPRGGWTDEYKTTKLVLRRIEAGMYKMGNNSDVELTRPFYMGVFEVTQKQYNLVMGSNPDLDWGIGDDYPAHSVSYDVLRGNIKGAQWPSSSEVDASSFIGKLQAKTGMNFDLPTEAQWEYACRAGTTTLYYWGDSMDEDYMWYRINNTGGPNPVGGKKPNAWGLYDMNGNAWEWCLDWYGSLMYGKDPVGLNSGSYRVSRGGGWCSFAVYCNSSVREYYSPSHKDDYGGFRLSKTIQRTGESEGGMGAYIESSSDPVLVDTTFNGLTAWVNTEIPIAYGSVALGGLSQIVINEESCFESNASGNWVWEPTCAGMYALEWRSGQVEMTATIRVSSQIETGVVRDGCAVIPDGTTDILGGAFAYHDDLTTVAIPNSVTNIGADAFLECRNLIRVDAASLENWLKIRFANAAANPLYNGADLYVGGEKVTDLVVPKGISTIGDFAFGGCAIESVVIPSSVVRIGTDAFSGCKGLNRINVNSVNDWLKIDFANDGANPLCAGADLYVQGERLLYRVDFDMNCELPAPASLECKPGLPCGELPTPTNEDGLFLGWYTAAEGGVKISPEWIVDADSTLHAHWFSVSDVEVFSGHPWQEVVIGYKITGSINQMTTLSVTARDTVNGQDYECKSLEGIDLTPGRHVIKWNAAKEGVKFKSEEVVFTVRIVPQLYYVIDLSGGPTATHYPIVDLAEAPHGGWSDEYRTTKLVLRRIGPGVFKMQNKYDVSLTKPFYMGIFEVTQKQYELVTGSNPSSYEGDMRPVESVSYDMIRGSSVGAWWPYDNAVDASSFLGKLRAKTGYDFDLPTDAQWEYACRAGTTTDYNNGGSDEDDLKEVGRYYSNESDGKGGYSDAHTKVGSYSPNAWGIYDMHGNVYEWCLDWYASSIGAATDPVGATSGRSRVTRGGNWASLASSCTSSVRSGGNPSAHSGVLGYGFRISVMRQNDVSFSSGGNGEEVFSKARSGVVPVDTTFEVGAEHEVGEMISISYGSVDPLCGSIITANNVVLTNASGKGTFRWGVEKEKKIELKWSSGMISMTSDLSVIIYHKISFDSNGGGEFATKTLLDGVKYGELPAPARTGFIFKGWFTAPVGGKEVTADSIADSDRTLYAHWEEIRYLISFNANGGPATPAAVSLQGELAYGELPVLVRSGYAFLGWFTSASGGTRITEDSIVDSARTLYAHWLAYGCTISQSGLLWDIVIAQAPGSDGVLTLDGERLLSSSNEVVRFTWQPETKGSHELVYSIGGTAKKKENVNVTGLSFLSSPAPNPPTAPNANITIKQTSHSFAVEGGAYSIPTAGVNGYTGSFAVSTSASWITINSAEVNWKAGRSIVYTVEANDGVEERTGYVYVGGHVHTITQAGVGAELSSYSTDVEAEGGEGRFTVLADAGTSWNARPNADWITISPTTGRGEKDVTFTVAPWNDVSTRSATITAAGRTFTVNQIGRHMKLDRSAISTDYNAQTVELFVSALPFVEWDVESSAPWISITDVGAGKGAGTIMLAVAENPSYLARTASVRIGTETVTISQAKRPMAALNFSIDPVQTMALAAGGTGIVTVAATPGLPWSAQSKADWIVLLPSAVTGTGNGDFTYVVEPNPALAERSGTIRVSPETASGLAGKTIVVVQSAATAEISEEEHEFAAKGETFEIGVSVLDVVKWNITTVPNWVTIEGGTSRTGAGVVRVTAKENLSIEAREATIIIAGHEFKITQSGRTVKVDPPIVGVSMSGGDGTINVIADANVIWGANPSDMWISIWGDNDCDYDVDGSIVDVGSGAVNYYIDGCDESELPRTGWIRIGDKRVNILQTRDGILVSVVDDPGAIVAGDIEKGFVVKPSEGKTAVEVTIPQGVDAAKVTVEITPKVASVKPNGAKVKVVVGDNDITGCLVIPESDGVMNIAAATVKEEIVKETLDPSKDAVIELNAANPRLITAPTRKGLTYTLFEGHALESLSKGDSKLGDGNSWKPTITVSGGDAGFYSIDVSK